MMKPWLIAISIAYLLGSIPFGYLLVRFFRNEDIRAVGSGNIGATNVVRSGAKGLGVLTLLLDLGKGLIAVLFAFQVARHSGGLAAQTIEAARSHAFDLAAAAAIAAVVGHVFPVWLGFRGGKGVATALGVFLALTPKASVGILAVFLAVVLITRYVSLGSIVASASYPVFALSFHRHPTPIVLACFLFIPALIIVKHHANIGRLLTGTENRFGSKPSQKAAA
jgi:glycerol-3-phosphate acyltransferase PlsY